MLSGAKWVLMAVAASMVALQSHGQGGIRLPDQPPSSSSTNEAITPQIIPQGRNGDREGRNILDWIGLGTGPDQDPYLARTNQACLSGDLAECFKSQALGSLNEFFGKESYLIADGARIVRMPENQLRSLAQEPYEFSTESRGEDSEWDALVKFAMRKVERFLKSSAFEIDIDNGHSEGGRYSPRFINEIAEEIDVLEDKKAPLFKRNQLKKLFIPMLLILKLFKLKLLLFLPLILGLASFKKLLGFLALVIPGVIGYFKLCKPNLNSQYGGFGHNNYYTNGPQYSPAGLGVHNYADTYNQHHHQNYGYYGREQAGGSVAFREDGAQQIAYQGWNQGEYRNSKELKVNIDKNV